MRSSLTESPRLGSFRFDKDSFITGSFTKRSVTKSPRTPKSTEHTPLVTDSRYHHHKTPPIFYIWIIPALTCALAYALYNVFIKRGSDSIHQSLGAVLLQIIEALQGTIFLIYLGIRKGSKTFEYDREGIFWSLLSGLAVGSAEMISFFVMSLGVQSMQTIPIIIGGSVMFSSLIGYYFLAEHLSYRRWSGVLCLITGIILASTDVPSE